MKYVCFAIVDVIVDCCDTRSFMRDCFAEFVAMMCDLSRLELGLRGKQIIRLCTDEAWYKSCYLK